jgi:hypothetical protein
MYKNATKCNETLSKWYKNKHGASKIIDTFETYQLAVGVSPTAFLSKKVAYNYSEISMSAERSPAPPPMPKLSSMASQPIAID